MDETNEVVEVDTELSPELESAFDESWGDDEGAASANDADEGSEANDEPVDDNEPDQDEDGNPEPDHDEEIGDGSEETEEPGNETETGNQRFKIKYNGNEEEYDLDQMTTLAQKGRDYDHVREERDNLKGKSGKYESFLQKLADKAGVSIEDQIALTEAMWLMDEEAEKGNSITEAEALLRVQKTHRDEAKTQEAPSRKKLTDAEVNRFVDAFPGVRGEDVPKEVWDEFAVTGDLVGAYQKYETKAEIKALKEENERLKQSAHNERNKQRSTGPLKTSGASRKKDDFDEGWDSEY